MWEKILKEKYDEIDIKIINLLNKDGRMTDKEISNIIGISKTAVRMRRIKLLKSGEIKIVGLLVLQNMRLSYGDAFIKFKSNAKKKFAKKMRIVDRKYSFLNNSSKVGYFIK